MPDLLRERTWGPRAPWQQHEVGKGSTMLRPTIVIWLVLLVMALTIVAFVSRLVERYRLADRFTNVQKERLYHAKQHTPS